MRTMYLGLTAVVISALAASPGWAQSTSEPVQASPGDSGQTGGADLSTPALLDAMSGDGAGVVSGMGSGSKVMIVPLPRFNDADRASVDAAMTKNQASVGALRTAARSNAAVQAALAARNIDADQVVAVRQAQNGDLIIYTR